MAAAPPAPFLPERELLSCRGPEDGLRPSPLVSYDEPLLLDSLALVPAQERWAGIRLASRFCIVVAVEVVLRTTAPVAAPRSLSSCLRTLLGRVVRPLAHSGSLAVRGLIIWFFLRPSLVSCMTTAPVGRFRASYFIGILLSRPLPAVPCPRNSGLGLLAPMPELPAANPSFLTTTGFAMLRGFKGLTSVFCDRSISPWTSTGVK